jgi:hypothetical protein
MKKIILKIVGGLLCIMVLLLSQIPSSLADEGGIEEQSAADLYRPQVVVMSGFFIELNMPAMYQSRKAIKNWLANKYPDAQFYSRHNSQWRKVCREFTPYKGKIVVMGLSYGGSAIVDVARCLEKAGVNITLSVAFDSVQRVGGADANIIPDNILRHANYYQRQNPVLQGGSNHHRPDGSYRGVTNELWKVKRLGAHASIILDVVESGVVYMLLEDAL